MELWKGFKTFVVADKVAENKYIDSFYLKPVEEEGGALPSYLPGQFISIRVPLENGTYSRARQYTLSELSNGEYYKISVKREETGNVSKLLCDKVQKGDQVEISAPAGKFVLEEGDRPVVLIGGGIGITPMLTMAKEAYHTGRKAQLIYSLPFYEYYAFDKEIKALSGEDSSVETTIVYTRPTEEDIKAKRFDISGRLTKEWLKANTPHNAQYYFCGPIEFMRAIYHHLIELGVEKEDIFYELFAPGEDITKPA